MRAQPKASRAALEPTAGGGLRAVLTAPPVDGAANAALVALVADRLGLPKRAVRLLRGEKSREKVLLIVGADLDTVRAAIARLEP